MTTVDVRSDTAVAAPASTFSGRVVLAGYYPPPLGGESVHVAGLARGLRARGVDVEIVNLRKGAPPSPDYRHVTGVASLWRALADGLRGGALLHLHTNGHSARSWSVVMAAAAVLLRTRSAGVLTLHSGLCPGYLGRRGRAGRALIRLALAPFAHVMCVNTSIRDALVGIGVAPGQLSVLPAFLGVEAPGALTDADAAMIARFRPYLVAAGGAGAEYGMDVLLAAVDQLRRRYPQLGCVVMGGGDSRPLRDAIGARGVDRHVVALGEVAHARYLALLARADVFVRPSLVDGDAISVREALALGRPVVASDTDFRPDGVVLFRRGDGNDLADKLAIAIEQVAGSAHAAGTVTTLDEVVSIYRRAAAGGARTPRRVAGTP